MLSPTASEVRAVIGGLVLILPFTTTKTFNPTTHLPLIEAVNNLRDAIEDSSYGREVATVVVVQATTKSTSKSDLDAAVEKLEDLCLSEKGILGWDFVGWDGAAGSGQQSEADDAGSRNEFGERIGIARVREVLEGVDWSADPAGDDDDELDFLAAGSGEETEEGEFTMRAARIDPIKSQSHDLQREMMGLKMSMLELDDDEGEGQDGGELSQVEQFQGLMERVVAIKEAGSEMEKEEREKFARREVGRIMKEMG